jgi:hypothetical protein
MRMKGSAAPIRDRLGLKTRVNAVSAQPYAPRFGRAARAKTICSASAITMGRSAATSMVPGRAARRLRRPAAPGPADEVGHGTGLGNRGRPATEAVGSASARPRILRPSDAGTMVPGPMPGVEGGQARESSLSAPGSRRGRETGPRSRTRAQLLGHAHDRHAHVEPHSPGLISGSRAGPPASRPAPPRPPQLFVVREHVMGCRPTISHAHPEVRSAARSREMTPCGVVSDEAGDHAVQDRLRETPPLLDLAKTPSSIRVRSAVRASSCWEAARSPAPTRAR